MNQAERFEEADAIGEWSSANLERIGLHMPDFSPIRPSAPCTRPLPTRAHQVTLSSSRITALCQSVEQARLDAHSLDYDRAEQAAMNPRSCIDADCAAVLDELVESGDLDADAIEYMLQEAAAKRENKPRVQTESKRRLLAAMKELIEAAEGTLDYSVKVRGAIAQAHTAFVLAGGL
jgi:hypothetical protein